MSGIFKTPKMPEMEDNNFVETMDAGRKAEEERERLAKRKGRAANILTQDYRGVSSTAKNLLGQ